MTVAASQDDALVAALRAGDERAFAQLVDAHGSRMRRLALSIVRNAAVADEVVQEAWLGVLRGLDALRGPGVAEDVDLPDRREHREDAGRARVRGASLLDLRERSGDGRAVGRPVPVPEQRRSASAGGWARFPEPWEKLDGDGDARA